MVVVVVVMPLPSAPWAPTFRGCRLTTDDHGTAKRADPGGPTLVASGRLLCALADAPCGHALALAVRRGALALGAGAAGTTTAEPLVPAMPSGASVRGTHGAEPGAVRADGSVVT